MDRTPFCSATTLICTQAAFARSRAAATILHDLPNGSSATTVHRALRESRGVEVRSL